jgi:hypothetical protein
MIAADLELLKFQKKKEFTSILEKELEYVNRDLTGMTASAALLSGFSFDALSAGPYQPGWTWAGLKTSVPDSNIHAHYLEEITGDFMHGPYMEFAYTTFACLSLSVNLTLVCYSTCVAMFGPNSALHVNNEAFLEQSLKALRRERKKCLQLLAAGVFLFVFTNIACVWYRWRGETGLVATIMTFVFAYYLKWMYGNMMRNYQAPDLMPVSWRPYCCSLVDRKETANLDVLYQGYLTIRVNTADKEEHWMIKYVEITSRSIRYRKSHTVRTENELLFNRGTLFLVQLFNSDQQLASIDGENCKHVFQVQHGMTSWIMQAASVEDMNQWMFKINQAASEYLSVDNLDGTDKVVNNDSPRGTRSSRGSSLGMPQQLKTKGGWWQRKKGAKGFSGDLKEPLLGDDDGDLVEMTNIGAPHRGSN